MSVKEIQSAITQLRPKELADLLEWIGEYEAEAWDRQIADDLKSGRLDSIRGRARQQRSAGQCRPL
jgi:hypothetical protein